MTAIRTVSDQRPAAAERIDYLDAAKGIFIIFIIMGHHLLGAEQFIRWLYSMGVTPFFLITGFLCAYRKEWEQPWGKVFAKKARKLLYPFLTFSVITLLWNVLWYEVIFTSQVPEYSMRKMILYTVTTYGYNALWYLPCALWGSLAFFALRKQKHHSKIWAAFSLCLVVFYVLFDEKLTGLGFVSYVYCYLFRVSLAAVFIYAGSALFELLRKMNKRQENLLLLICAAVSLIIAVLYQLYPQHFPIANIAAHRMGNPYVYYLAAVSNTLVILLLCRKFPGGNKALKWCGRNSLILMALHMDVTIRIAWWTYPKFHVDFGPVVNSLIVIGMELLMFVIIVPLITRCFPFILSPKRRLRN